jgi:glycosyltransferase involved in cell wall biosynthesis
MNKQQNIYPKISIVTPCLNAVKTIERTLRSIESQAYPNLEVIVVDGLSSDGTIEVIRRYQNMVTQFISEKDHGVAEAINKGFRLATGEVFYYLNADDCVFSGALNHVAELFRTFPEVDVITGACQRVFADGSTLITQVPSHFLDVISMRNDIEQPSTFWRASIHHKLGEFDESFSFAFDHEWWNRLYAFGANFKITRDILSIYYFSNDNLTSTAGMRVINEMYRITKAYGPYRGYIADVYRVLFKVFDQRGFYDQPFRHLSRQRQMIFGTFLAVLYGIFDKQSVNSYNWNWASKQIRGATWYK